MNIIGNKLFAYIDNHSELTTSMVQQYNDSMIFIGDEKQIFVPHINAYVGIGNSAYLDILSKIRQNNENLNEYNKYIHNDTVTSIYVQFTPEEIETFRNNTPVTIRGNFIDETAKSEVAFKANKNVVVKGLNDYNLQNGNDELGRAVSTHNTSGITVNINHEGTIYTGQYSINGTPYTYSYYNPYDVITIDDTKTWSYITTSNTYLTHFVTTFATEQANRVYKNILGYDEVYIEKEFDEAFHYDINDNQLYEIEDVYVKLNDGSYQKVVIENKIDQNNPDNNCYSIHLGSSTGDIIYSTDPQVSQQTTDSNILNHLADQNNGGYEVLLSGKLIPIWYNKDEESSASAKVNIADGIETIREVAYILDKLSDGAFEDGINLAYNIAEHDRDIEMLKNWQNDIGNETVSSFKSESLNNLLTVDYYSTNLWNKDKIGDELASTGYVKLDIDLKLAKTYIINNVSYAAYMNEQLPDGQTKYFVSHLDPTNIDNYILVQNIDDNVLNKIRRKYGNNREITIYRITGSGTPITNANITGIEISGGFSTSNSNADILSNLTSFNNNYIYFPYDEVDIVASEGLTDVKWVTSYVHWVVEDINNRINSINVDSDIQRALADLDYIDEDQHYSGLFVSYVTETDGKISVHKERLPLDTILRNDVFYTNDIYLHISTEDAKKSNYHESIYELQNNQFVHLTTTQVGNLSSDRDLDENIYYKTSLATMTAVPGGGNNTGATVEEMILNAGNVSYFYKKESNGYTEYIPLDIQTAYTNDINGDLFDDNYVKKNDTIYYWIGNANQIKYFDISTLQRTDGSTTTLFTSYITYLSAASEQNSGLTDAWDVRRTIENMFKWVDLKTNKIIE